MPRPRVPARLAAVRHRAPRGPTSAAARGCNPETWKAAETWEALDLERLTAAGRGGDQASSRKDRYTRCGGGATADEMREMQRVKPELVAQIRFVEWTAEGRLRHAAFLGLRSDKSAREVRREWPGSSGG